MLAIGVPFETDDVPFESDEPGRVHAGAVNVLYGTAAEGLTDTDSFFERDILQGSIPGAAGAQPGDRFGTTLAAAPVVPQLLSRDIELVIGAPFVDLAPSITNAGAVNVLYRRTDVPLFSPFGAQEWTRNTPGVAEPPHKARAGDRFGG